MEREWDRERGGDREREMEREMGDGEVETHVVEQPYGRVINRVFVAANAVRCLMARIWNILDD